MIKLEETEELKVVEIIIISATVISLSIPPRVPINVLTMTLWRRD